MKRFDIQNNGNNTGEYPLFFGKPLGLFDIANEPYPEIEKLDDDQQALYWKANDYDLTQDAVELSNMSENNRGLVVENLSMQMAGDSLAAGLISDLFSPIMSNNAATSLVAYWSFSETVHAKAYARIASEAFSDTNELMERAKNSEKMLKRLDIIRHTFQQHKVMLGSFNEESYELNPSYYQKTVLKTLVALVGLEGIMFLGSFANTFAVCESTQKLASIAGLVGLIHDDEAISHRNNALTFLRILRDKEKYSVWDECLPEMKEILDTIVNQEQEWADHLFKLYKPLVGFNAELLKDYILFVAKVSYDHIGIPFDHKVVEVSPFAGWMEQYTKADIIQIAQQETEGSNYLTSTSIDDTASVDEFDFED